MRPLEAILLLVTGAAASALVVSKGRARCSCLALAALLLVASAQLSVEGARCQLWPADAACALLLGASPFWLRRADAGGGSTGRRAAAGLGVTALLLSAALAVAVPVSDLPPPTGPYSIGVTSYHWVDASRSELFTGAPDDWRELIVQVWCPAEPSDATRARHVEDGAALAPLARLLRLPGFFFGHLEHVKTRARIGAPATGSEPRYPLILFSHGRGGFRQHSTFQAEELASHGYVVAAIDHPYVAACVAFPDGRRAEFDARMMEREFEDRMFPYLAQDVGFTLDQLARVNEADPHGLLTGRLDVQNAGMFGLSLGGAITAQACLRDRRLEACLAIDVFMPLDVVREGLKQPTMWISRDAATMRDEGWGESDIEETHTTMRSVFEEHPGDAWTYLGPAHR